MINREDLNSFSTYLLAKEAQERGIKVEKIFPESKSSRLKLELNGETCLIFGQTISKLTVSAYRICDNKEITRKFLKDANIKTTEGKEFTSKKIKEAVDFAQEAGFPVVVKPSKGTWGKNVFLDIRSVEEIEKAIKAVTEDQKSFLVEKQFEGDEYRILATKDKLLGVINRVPANVVGDGEKSIEELIEVKNQDPRRGEGHTKSLVKIQLDDDLKNNLKEQDLDLKSVIEKDRQVFLRKMSNLSQGGDSIDITDEVHPKIKELAPKIIQAVPGLPYA
ncbi:MAG: bifunctional glutamate--cysteine ligase GshA/glutathione synthetase GshB, partial [Candidatus Moranbacteria bacterium]|nr:bifunctional glutamate--cysteine ligase GshA/glutathione synthetase GshB [Candidatus Moranbacteria bacterium]